MSCGSLSVALAAFGSSVILSEDEGRIRLRDPTCIEQELFGRNKTRADLPRTPGPVDPSHSRFRKGAVATLLEVRPGGKGPGDKRQGTAQLCKALSPLSSSCQAEALGFRFQG